MKFEFEVWCERHKTVEIEAENLDQAWDEIYDQIYDIDMDDAYEAGDREITLVKEG